MRPRMSVLLSVLLSIASAGAAELNTLSDLKVIPTNSGAQVVVRGNRAPTFTVFRLNDPERLVIDVSGADATAIRGHHPGSGPISGVVASQFADGQSSVGRLLVAVGKNSKYDVRADGDRVVASIEVGSAAGETLVPAMPPPALPDRAVSESPEVAADHVVANTADERAVAKPARHVTSLRYSGDRLQIRTDGQIAKYEVVSLADPPRLALDIFGVSLKAKVPKIRAGAVREIRVGAHEDKIRLVLDMREGTPSYRALRTRHGMELVLSAAPSEQPAPETAPAVEVAAGLKDGEIELDGQKLDTARSETARIEAKPAAVRTAEIKDLSFSENPAGGRLELKLSAPASWKVDQPDPRSLVLTLDAAHLPKKLERSLDTSALDTPIKMISAFPVPGEPGRVRVVVAANGQIHEKMEQSAHGLTWQLTATEAKADEVASAPKAAAFATEAPALAKEGVVQRVKYVGKKVSFEFKDIDIHNLLRVIAEVSKKNIVVADDVTGKVTIRLRNVPWDQAFELILRSKNLGKEEMGNIVRVAPLKQLEEEAKLREERRKAQIRQEELIVQLIPVNYATAQEMSSRVKEVLSERGTVTVDTRTNVLIVRDISSNISRARSLVQNLDTQTQEVLIESRIVEANTSFTKNIGVQWGGGAQFAPGTGNPTGLSFPYTAAARGGSSPASNAGTADVPNFAVNLPAPVGQGSGGAVGLVFGSAGGAFNLNLRLSALENQGSVKTISAPKVTTLDNNTAKISQGVSIPFSQVSAGGVNTTFIEARLSLEVTPHITHDGSILMNIRAENNQPDPSNTGANGQPAIQRKEASTQVLVKDGDTTVIGGIYVRRGANQVSTIPFFGKIPILGFFFRNTSESDSRQELLIFITPRITNRQTIAQSL